MNDISGPFVLLEPASPESLIPDAWIEPWMVSLGLIFIAAVAAIFIFRMRNKSASDPSSARSQARATAAAALDQIDSSHPRDTAVQSSLILRKYLSTAAGDPALFETHEETLARHEAFKGFSAEARAAAARGFSALAALKYAPDAPEIEPVDVIRDSRDLLETLHQGFQA